MTRNNAQIARTNADLVADVAAAAGEHLAAIGAWAAAHPDEVATAAAPLLVVLAATRRRQLSFAEAFALTEVGYWCGVLALKEYRRWKARPAPPGPPLLVKVG